MTEPLGSPLYSDPVLLNGIHVMSHEGWCWCQPRIRQELPFGELYIHRHFWDRPEYEPEPDS